ncbi:PH domain-containing protein [Domibacillus sp. PGB-M46]|uniref:PH domain-containing protein n=1 Tax=Domibacillus sp. PGB-M46 TaxID=2910255 RepID=UPI001F5AD41A|nr:PH domain-containing protein [Domibacillus sp. PGB-M46]MCI2255160.1 PH domain-containing protein [Domibacillus sp. PGB-M46]
METNIKAPSKSISPQAVKMWRLSRAIGHAAAFFLISALLAMDAAWGWWSWIGWLLYGSAGFTLLSAVFTIGIEPSILQRTWRYEVSEEYVQLKHGALTRVHVLVPMAKVEYVTTNQGPVMRKYGLYNVVIGTMASSHNIPAVPEKEAFALREQIAELAQVKDNG